MLTILIFPDVHYVQHRVPMFGPIYLAHVHSLGLYWILLSGSRYATFLLLAFRVLPAMLYSHYCAGVCGLPLYHF